MPAARLAAGSIDARAAALVADYVLDSDPTVARVPRRAEAGPGLQPVLERPRTRRAAPPVLQGVDDPVARLEARVAHHEATTQGLLADLHAQYAGELARLDTRLRTAELSGEPASTDLEDRVQSGFMELVVKLEALERQLDEQATSKPPSDTRAELTSIGSGDHVHRSVVESITAHFLDQTDQLDARTATVERRLGEVTTATARLEAGQQQVVDRQTQFSAAETVFAEAQQQMGNELAAVLERLDALTDQVTFGFQQIPRIEHRVKSMESRVATEMDGLRAQVDELASRFPAVEAAAELTVRHGAAIANIEQTFAAFSARSSGELTGVRDQLAALDGIRDDVDRTIATTGETRSDFLRLQAEVDRRSNDAEGRLAELEDVIGNEAGVDRQLLLDRIEEMERGITELDPDRFATRADLDQIRTQLPDPPVGGR